MKGLKKYIRKHGRHFTEELAYKVVGNRWTLDRIESITDTLVWYNVTGTTPGDIIYLVNAMHTSFCPVYNIRGVCRRVVELAGDYDLGMELAFDDWFDDKAFNKDFDFTPYI